MMRRVIAASALALLVTGCAATPSAQTSESSTTATTPTSSGPTRLEVAAGVCNLKTGGTANFGDNGHTLTLDRMLFRMQACILDQLDTPDSVLAQMLATRAIDGMQHAEWGTVTASWTYYPDDGLGLILTATD